MAYVPANQRKKFPWTMRTIFRDFQEFSRTGGSAMETQEPMRAEGPKERPTAVLTVQLSARYVQILRPSGYYIITF